MYPMREFQERDPSEIAVFIQRYPLAMLTGTTGEGKLTATHVPLLLEDRTDQTVLRGHIMRKTEYWQAFKANPEVLVAFSGPNAPVLASWMTDLAFGGTWNYMAVHARGVLRFTDQESLVNLLRDLKNRFEVDDRAMFDLLPPDYVPRLIDAVEGFEIEVTSIEAVFKLSQNRSLTDFDQVIQGLTANGGGSALVAEEMTTRRSRFFPGS